MKKDISKSVEKIPLRTRNEFKNSGGYYAKIERHNEHEGFELYKTDDCTYDDALKIIHKHLGRVGKKVEIKFISQHCAFPWYNFLIIGRPYEKEFSVEFRKVIDLTQNNIGNQ